MIVDDEIVETKETFTAILNSSDNGVRLPYTDLIVTINDNDLTSK